MVAPIFPDWRLRRSGIIISADAVGRFIVKVFGHPDLIANFHGLVSLAVARVFEGIRGSIEFAAGTV